MKTIIITAFVASLWAYSSTQNMAFSHDGHDLQNSKLKLENLRKDKLEGVENTEVVVSRVTIPPNTRLPTHWQPGEEFAYVIEGSVTLWQEGKEDTVIKAGGAEKVPLKQVHTAFTGDEGSVILVFRVHEIGKKERYLVK